MKKFLVLLLSFLFLGLSCGGSIDLGPGGCVSAPEGATITISPSSIDVTDATSLAWHTAYFQIKVTDENGIPLNDVELWISFIWAVPDEAGYVQLYDGDIPKNSPMKVCTDEDGVYNLTFRFQSGGGRDYYADLEVRSGSVYGSASFTVSPGGTT
jgi:hypothetical protein